jgi:hypothetical protein
MCAKNPGFPVDIFFRGPIAKLVAVYLGHVAWRDAAGNALSIEGNPKLAR